MKRNKPSPNYKIARNDSVLITNVQRDFDGMCTEMYNYYKELIEEVCHKKKK